MRKNHRTNAIFAAAGLCAFLAVPSVSSAADKALPSIETLAEQAATTPGQHQVLAAYHRGKADEARADVTKHREMAFSFSAKSGGGMQGHCNGLADAAQKAATEYDGMAAVHDQEAKSAAK